MKIPENELPKRYDLAVLTDDGDPFVAIVGKRALKESPEGEWVRFSDYQKLYNERGKVTGPRAEPSPKASSGRRSIDSSKPEC